MNITLTIENETYDVLQCKYVFWRDVDPKGRPDGGLRGGDIHVTMESTENNLLFEEFARKDGPRAVSGRINLLNSRVENYVRTIEFKEAYIYALSEKMMSHSHLPMTQTIAISPLRLDINKTVRMDRRFPQTYNCNWEEYKSEVEPTRVKDWFPTTTSSIITSIELLEGDKEITGKNEVVQYVNIQKDPDKHVDGKVITHADRLGRKLRCKVKFEESGTFTFKVKLVPGSKNSSYTPSEKKRNKNFEYCKEEKEFTTDANGEAIIELADNLFVSPAGGDLFSIEATDEHGNTATASAMVRTRRLLYYVELISKMLGNKSSLPIGVFENEFKTHGIELKKLTTLEVDYPRANLTSNEDQSNYNRKIRETYNASVGKNMEPYCFALAYTGQNARMGTHILPGSIEKDGTQTDTIIETNEGTFLWLGVDDTDWLIEGYCKNLDTGETKTVTEEMCIPNMLTYYGNTFLYDSIKVDTSSLDNGRWEIRIKANIIKSFITGYTLNNIQVIATNRLGNTPRDADEISQTMVHETGHLIGMACNASGILPDSTPDYYYHTGHHCNKPAACVMYRSTNGCTEFCGDCAIAVKKVDLKDGIK